MISPCYSSSCSEKNTVNLKDLWLQLLFYNRKRVIRRMDSCNWRQLTLHLWKQRWLYKCLFQRKIVPLEILGPWKCLPKIMVVPLKCMAACAPLKLQYALNRNICQIHCIYAIHGCKCCSEINTVSVKEWMAATNFVK